MIGFFVQLVLSIYWLLRAVLQALLLNRRSRYRWSGFIDAPVDTVWSIIVARNSRYEGMVPLIIESDYVEGDREPYLSRITIGDEVLDMYMRTVESRPPEAMLVELLQEGTDPQLIQGSDHYVSMTSVAERGGTRFTIEHDLAPLSFWSRIVVPLGAYQSVARVRQAAEDQAGTRRKSQRAPLRAAVLTGVVTLASFATFAGWTDAAILIALLILHELGHVIAMRWCGLPVHGVYFIPFMGAVAVGGSGYGSQAERGLVALMGPGFSVLSTAALYWLAQQSGNPLIEKAALLSAILNLLNLLPVLPLDGGHVVGALLSRWNKDLVRLLELAAVVSAIAAAVYFKLTLTALFLGLTFAFLISARRKPLRLRPVAGGEAAWLLAGYAATSVFYVGVILGLFRVF